MVQPDAGAPDEILVVAAILGDLDAFDELVMRYRPAVIRTARIAVPGIDAEDVSQEALLLAFKALPSLEEPEKFPAWLNAITRRCAIRHSQRESARQRTFVPLDQEILERLPALSRPAARESADEALRQALDGIPPEYATVLRLHFLDEMPLKRIAGFMGVSLATVKWRIYRGKALVRGRFKLLIGRSQRWKRKGK